MMHMKVQWNLAAQKRIGRRLRRLWECVMG